jgi:energy-converting hydrogenase Eha subunit A
MGDFGIKHLTGLAWLFSIIITLLVTLLHIRKEKQNKERFDLAVIKGTTIFIWGWEFVKTVYMIKSPDFGGVGNYPAFMLPFHICSMALYAYLIIGFKPGKLADYIKPFGFATMLLVTLLILTIPASSGIMGNLPHWKFVSENTLPYQSFLYHGSLVFVPLYMMLSGFYQPKIKDIGKATVTLLAVACFAFVLNKILGVTDFMTIEKGNGNPFQYLIEDSYLLYLLILASITTAGTTFFLAVGQLITKRKIKA